MFSVPISYDTPCITPCRCLALTAAPDTLSSALCGAHASLRSPCRISCTPGIDSQLALILSLAMPYAWRSCNTHRAACPSPGTSTAFGSTRFGHPPPCGRQYTCVGVTPSPARIVTSAHWQPLQSMYLPQAHKKAARISASRSLL